MQSINHDPLNEEKKRGILSPIIIKMEKINKCENCGQTYENHPLWNGLTGRWLKSHIKGQHRLRSIKFMCKDFKSQEEK